MDLPAMSRGRMWKGPPSSQPKKLGAKLSACRLHSHTRDIREGSHSETEFGGRRTGLSSSSPHARFLPWTSPPSQHTVVPMQLRVALPMQAWELWGGEHLALQGPLCKAHVSQRPRKDPRCLGNGVGVLLGIGNG